MIGTHNSLTAFPCKKWWFKPFTFLWRCQDMSIFEQYEQGVKFFDIRIRVKKGHLYFCHGLVDLKVSFTFNELLRWLRTRDCHCRIVFERGGLDEVVLQYIINDEFLGDTVTEVVVKKDWRVVAKSLKGYKIIDYSYVPFYSNKSFWENLKQMSFSTIKKWSKKKNPVVTRKMMEDKETIYFMDYYE